MKFHSAVVAALGGLSLLSNGENAAFVCGFSSSTPQNLATFNLNKVKDVSQYNKVVLKAAPRGVPTISNWRVNRDGSITGIVSGSKDAEEGKSINTGPLQTGVVIKTASGERFYLESAEETKAIAAKKAAEAKAAIEKKKLEAVAQKAKAKKSFFTKGNKNTAVETARSTSVTGGVFGINQRSSAANRKSQPARSVESPPRIYTTAPRGVPTLSRWKLNRNQAISGLIYDSSSYDDGKRVTSAPLEEGTKAVAGAVVKSVSGSRYYLATAEQGREKAMAMLTSKSTSFENKGSSRTKEQQQVDETSLQQIKTQRAAALLAVAAPLGLFSLSQKSIDDKYLSLTDGEDVSKKRIDINQFEIDSTGVPSLDKSDVEKGIQDSETISQQNSEETTILDQSAEADDTESTAALVDSVSTEELYQEVVPEENIQETESEEINQDYEEPTPVKQFEAITDESLITTPEPTDEINNNGLVENDNAGAALGVAVSAFGSENQAGIADTIDQVQPEGFAAAGNLGSDTTTTNIGTSESDFATEFKMRPELQKAAALAAATLSFGLYSNMSRSVAEKMDSQAAEVTAAAVAKSQNLELQKAVAEVTSEDEIGKGLQNEDITEMYKRQAEQQKAADLARAEAKKIESEDKWAAALANGNSETLGNEGRREDTLVKELQNDNIAEMYKRQAEQQKAIIRARADAKKREAEDKWAAALGYSNGQNPETKPTSMGPIDILPTDIGVDNIAGTEMVNEDIAQFYKRAADQKRAAELAKSQGKKKEAEDKWAAALAAATKK